MTNVYDQHAAAFKGISAYVIAHEGKQIGKIAFKRGNCRVTCYLHIHGLMMQKGTANGGGYDMASAAAYAAISKPFETKDAFQAQYHALGIRSVLKDDSQHWDNALRAAGYEVMGAI